MPRSISGRGCRNGARNVETVARRRGFERQAAGNSRWRTSERGAYRRAFVTRIERMTPNRATTVPTRPIQIAQERQPSLFTRNARAIPRTPSATMPMVPANVSVFAYRRSWFGSTTFRPAVAAVFNLRRESYQRISASRARLISAGSMPSHSSRTSAVCSPKRGAGRAGPRLEPDIRIGSPVCVRSPTSGWSTSLR